MSKPAYLTCQDCGGLYLQSSEWQHPELCSDCFERRTAPQPEPRSDPKRRPRQRLSPEEMERGIRVCRRCKRRYQLSSEWFDPTHCPSCSKKAPKYDEEVSPEDEYVGLVVCQRCGGSFYPSDEPNASEYCLDCAEAIEEERQWADNAPPLFPPRPT